MTLWVFSLAPNYFSGHLTSKSDVYSFGVVLLEILTGRRSMDKKRPSGEQNLVSWARPYLDDKRKLYHIIDPRLELNYSMQAVQKVSRLASHCISRDPKSRPTMDEVVKVLVPLQDLSDLAILTYHSRLSQQGRRKKKPEGLHQLTYTQPKNIRTSPMNVGVIHRHWWLVVGCCKNFDSWSSSEQKVEVDEERYMKFFFLES